RQPEKHESGYNNILLPVQSDVTTEMMSEAAALLKLSVENVGQLVSQHLPVPVARTASREEAELVTLRLRDLGLSCVTVSDEELGLASTSDNVLKRVRAMSFADDRVLISQSGTEETYVSWSDVILILPARLIETRVEIKERMTRKPVNEILDT